MGEGNKFKLSKAVHLHINNSILSCPSYLVLVRTTTLSALVFSGYPSLHWAILSLVEVFRVRYIKKVHFLANLFNEARY